jgi:hypothetical protein
MLIHKNASKTRKMPQFRTTVHWKQRRCRKFISFSLKLGSYFWIISRNCRKVKDCDLFLALFIDFFWFLRYLVRVYPIYPTFFHARVLAGLVETCFTFYTGQHHDKQSLFTYFGEMQSRKERIRARISKNVIQFKK